MMQHCYPAVPNREHRRIETAAGTATSKMRLQLYKEIENNETHPATT